MNNGGTNIFTSRRTNYLHCKYWVISQEEAKTKDKSVLIHEKVPEGYFDARIESDIENTSSVISQSFMFDSNSVSISTTDFVDNLKKNCLVECMGAIWRVENVSRTPIRNNYEFWEPAYRTYLQLRR